MPNKGKQAARKEAAKLMSFKEKDKMIEHMKKLRSSPKAKASKAEYQSIKKRTQGSSGKGKSPSPGQTKRAFAKGDISLEEAQKIRRASSVGKSPNPGRAQLSKDLFGHSEGQFARKLKIKRRDYKK